MYGADKLAISYDVQGVDDDNKEAAGVIQLMERLRWLGERLGGQGVTELTRVKRAVHAWLEDVDLGLGVGRPGR